jgi:hypothetical protein
VAQGIPTYRIHFSCFWPTPHQGSICLEESTCSHFECSSILARSKSFYSEHPSFAILLSAKSLAAFPCDWSETQRANSFFFSLNIYRPISSTFHMVKSVGAAYSMYVSPFSSWHSRVGLSSQDRCFRNLYPAFRLEITVIISNVGF